MRFADLVTTLAAHTPAVVKRFFRANPRFYRTARKLVAAGVRTSGDFAVIQSGPAQGTRLAVSEHVSHAHLLGTYERELMEAVDHFLTDGAVCYDLGASIGYVALLMARKASRVYAFEPSPIAQREMKRHIAANGFTNIVIVDRPVSDSEHEVRFAVSDVAYDSMISLGETKAPTLQLRTVALDEFVRNHEWPDLIKIDVEWHEGHVLEGARDILARGTAVILCELHGVDTARHVLSLLSHYDYRISTLQGSTFEVPATIVPGEVHIIGVPPRRAMRIRG